MSISKSKFRRYDLIWRNERPMRESGNMDCFLRDCPVNYRGSRHNGARCSGIMAVKQTLENTYLKIETKSEESYECCVDHETDKC